MKKNIKDYQGEVRVRVRWDPDEEQGVCWEDDISIPTEFVVHERDLESRRNSDVRSRLRNDGDHSYHVDSVYNRILDEICKICKVESVLNEELDWDNPDERGKIWVNDWRHIEEDNQTLVGFLQKLIEYVEGGFPLKETHLIRDFLWSYFVEGSEQEKKFRENLISLTKEMYEEEYWGDFTNEKIGDVIKTLRREETHKEKGWFLNFTRVRGKFR